MVGVPMKRSKAIESFDPSLDPSVTRFIRENMNLSDRMAMNLMFMIDHGLQL
jgi:hypothetical protein